MKKQILLLLTIIGLGSCANKQEVIDNNDYKLKSKITMQRVKDTNPLAKQDLVSREAMQYAMLDKMNVREDRQRREFKRIQDQQQKEFTTAQNQQREDFLTSNKEHTYKMEAIKNNIIDSNDKFVEITQATQRKVDTTFDAILADNDATTKRFNMIASDIQDASKTQSDYFNQMRIKYENKIAFDQARIAREKERENTIRGVVDNMYEDQDTALRQYYSSTKDGMLPPSEWVSLEEAPISLHVEDQKFEGLILRAVNNAAVHSGPWNLKWKLKKENENLLHTKFSLDVETDFGTFITDVKRYILNYNGVVLYFRVFKEKRILIVSDS